jgi:SAM-dependent methyltransferase
MKPYFIDKNINILTGNKALDALSKENDENFLSDDKGVIKVSSERWKKAQYCERKHWLEIGLKSNDDRNQYHSKIFNNYENIKNEVFDNVLEIGCGPFTNLRIIAKFCKIKECSLLDPLVFDYLEHPFSSYNKDYLFSESFPLLGKIVSKIFPNYYKFYLKNLSQKIIINELLNIPVEKLPLTKKYDLVTMINVIEHCYDIQKIFQNILEITKKGSYFIFSDKLYNHTQISKEIKIGYDAAHPLKVDKQVVETFLYDNFEITHNKIQNNTMNMDGETFLWDDIYFIGKRK